MTSAETAAILGRLAYVDVPCRSPSDPLAPIPGPSCPPGVTPGTLIPVFLLTGCESTYEPASSIGHVVEGLVQPDLRLFTVYRVEPPSVPGTFPAGVYGVAFTGEFPGRPPAGPKLVVVTLDGEGHIVRWSSSCGVVDPKRHLEEEHPVAEYLLPPLP